MKRLSQKDSLFCCEKFHAIHDGCGTLLLDTPKLVMGKDMMPVLTFLCKINIFFMK